jgi:hypothetical protein
MAANNIYIQVDFNSANAQANVNALNQSIANTGPTAAKSSAQATTGLNSVSVSVQQVNREFSQLTNVIASLGIGRAIAGMIQMSAELSRTQAAMAGFTGSVAEANRVFEEVRAIAAQSPFRFKDLEETAQRLLGFGFAAKNVPYILNEIKNQAVRMGTGIEGVNTIVNVFGRIMEKNFVGAVDLMRALPAQGIPALEALGKEMKRQGREISNVEDVKKALKDGIIEPLQAIRVILESLEHKPVTFTGQAAVAFKNLADAIDNALGKLFGPDGFGPALTKLGEKIGEVLAPLGGLLDKLMKLSPETKEWIVDITALAAAFALFGTALGIVTSLAGPLTGLVKAMWAFDGAAAAANPELTAVVVLFTALNVALYNLVPGFKKFVDGVIDPMTVKVKAALADLGAEGKKFMAGLFSGGTPLEKGEIVKKGSELFKTLSELEEKHASEAKRTLLEAYAAPVESVQMKYATLFDELRKKMKDLPAEEQAALSGILGGAEVAEINAAQFKEKKKQLDEIARYQVESAKGAADAQVAYIEAQNVQDLRNKVRAIDQVTQIRIDRAKQVGDIEAANLQKQFDQFEQMAKDNRDEFANAGIDVDEMIAAHRKELTTQQALVERKAFDESQKYRQEGWKKANDVIIEEQKRVYDAFKDQFSQLFDVFTDKTKSLGAALGDFFKKMVVGEAKELFATSMASAATQAAGYGRPEESITRGGSGILGILLRRGTPPRPPLPPPEVEKFGTSVSGMSPLASSMQVSAHTFEIAASTNQDSALIFAEAVNRFAGTSSQGSAARMATGEAGGAFETASGATGVPQALLRAVAQTESNMNPLARSNRGAMGLMQLMPGTAAGRGVTSPFDIGQNVMGGAKELQWLLNRYGGDTSKALAAYNYGVGNYEKAVAAGRPLPLETQLYVAKVQRLMTKAAPGGADTESTAETARYIRATGADTGKPSPFGGYDVTNLPMAGAGLPASFGLPTYGQAAGGLANLPQGASSMAALAPFLGPLMGGAMKAGQKTAASQGMTLPKPGDLGEFFGVVPGVTSLGTILTSRAAGMLATLGGTALATRGLQQHYAPATVAGGGLAGAGYLLSNPALMARVSEQPGGFGLGLGAAAATGAGLGLFASGFQRGGGAGVAMDIGGGALAGAGIGTMIAPGLGTAIGAAIGAGVGAITGVVRLFVKTEQERIRTGIKQVYGIDISNRQILTQIQQIVDQKYGGSVTIGIRSQDVQDIVRLYALSTGQAANLPRPMYAATIAQSQAGGLATQPVYQGGVLVQNPYTGPTTYQYQTAVTAAQGLMAGTSQGVPGAGNTVGSIFMQLNPQQANDLFTGRVVQAVQQNPAAVASANANATRAGDSRVSQASNMLEPLTSLS